MKKKRHGAGRPPLDNWQRFSEKDQLRTLLRIIDRLTLPKTGRLLSEDVVRIGMGARRLDGAEGRATWKHDELTLVAYVNAKRPESEIPLTRRIKRYFACRVTIGKKQVRLRIPTDVRKISGEVRAHYLPLATNVTMTPAPQGLAMVGTLCGRFKKVNTTNPIYALTCQHVACASEEQPDLAANAGATAWSVDQAGALPSKLGTVTFKTPFGSVNVLDECLDAALIELQPGCDALKDDYWPASPASVIEDQLSLKKEWGASATLFSRFYPDGIAVSAPTWVPRLVVNYKTQSARISLALEYDLNGQSSQPGDSGSAIISDSNRLLAMHIAGVNEQPTGYAIPINLLLDPDTLGVQIQLA